MSNASPFKTSTFQELSNDIRNATKNWCFTPGIALWSFRSPPGLHLPKWELPWECEGALPHTPSHFLTLLGVCDVTPGLPLGLDPCNAFALTPGLPSFLPVTLQPFYLGRKPKARVATTTNQPFRMHLRFVHVPASSPCLLPLLGLRFLFTPK
jgi:hypothetical protein